MYAVLTAHKPCWERRCKAQWCFEDVWIALTHMEVSAQSLWNQHRSKQSLLSSLCPLSAFVCKLLPIPVYPQRCNEETGHIAKCGSQWTGNGPYLKEENAALSGKVGGKERHCGFMYFMSTSCFGCNRQKKPKCSKVSILECYALSWRMPKVLAVIKHLLWTLNVVQFLSNMH